MAVTPDADLIGASALAADIALTSLNMQGNTAVDDSRDDGHSRVTVAQGGLCCSVRVLSR